MTPVHFDGETIVLRAPRNWDASEHGPCDDLPVMQRDGVCVSCWKPTWRERLALLFGRKIYLHIVSGMTQPPIAIEVE